MKYRLLLFILLLYLSSYGQNIQWANQVKGLQDETETANFIEVDNNGNTYTLGISHSQEYDIDPTQNGVQLINNQNPLVAFPEDIYLIKLNTDGDFLWGKSLSILKEDDKVLGLQFDSQGNIYVLAFMTELYQNQTLINGYGSVNVIKIDSDGNEIYRRKIRNQGNINDGKITAIASFDIDSSDNIYVSGVFQDTVLLDNNPLNDLVATGDSMYTLKLNQNGDILWSKNLNYIISGNISLNIDSNNEIDILFNSFDNLNNNQALNILKLNNSDGNQIWLKSLENVSLNHVELDTNNNFIIVGKTGNNADLNPDPNITNLVQNGSFILFLDSNGNYYDSKLFDSNISFHAIGIDNSNAYHFGGSFNSTVDFDPSANTYYITSLGFANDGYHNDGFYLKLDSNRDFFQASIIGTPPFNNFETCYSSQINSLKTFNENIFMAGEFAGNCDLDPVLGAYYALNSINFNVKNSDGFISKFRNCDINSPNGNANQTVCASQNPTINSLITDSFPVNWYDSATSTNQLSTTSAIIDGHIYYASKQVGNCPETQRLAVTVTIAITPIPQTAPNQKFCQKENSQISNISITGEDIRWYDSLAFFDILSDSTPLLDNTTYYATQTINNCQSARTPVSITITEEVLPTATSPQSFCIQQNPSLNDITITGQIIKWYDALTAGNFLVNTTSLQNGITYYASETIDGCEGDRIPVVIDIQNTPAPTGVPTQIFCTNQNPTLSNLVVVGTTIKWYDSATLGNLLTDSTPLTDGKTYYATQFENNCESPIRLAVTASLISSLPATDYNFPICDDLNDGIEYAKLEDFNSFLISNSSTYSFSYYESLSGAENELTPNKITTASNYKLSLGENRIYVRINSDNPCYYGIAVLKISLFSKPIIPIQDIVPICENKGVLIDAGSSADSYLWSNGKTDQIITVENPENLSVTVTKNYDGISCSSDKTFSVKTSDIVKITAIETKDWTDNDNTIKVFVSGSGDFEYSIDGINYQNSNQFLDVKSGEYTVQVRDKYGCGTATEEVYLLMYPKFFTPNGDGFNDTWKIIASDIEKNLTFKIFDRFGKLIKELNSDSVGWDGTYMGQALPSTDYWFVVKRENGKEYKNHFSLKR
jgi:gliding motility-associated-like protein